MTIKGSFILREVAGSHVVVPVGSSAVDFNGMITLNETGAFLWELLSQGSTTEELIQRLTEEYDVTPEAARHDVEVFLQRMRDNDFLAL